MGKVCCYTKDLVIGLVVIVVVLDLRCVDFHEFEGRTSVRT